jgi:hypothetical protein
MAVNMMSMSGNGTHDRRDLPGAGKENVLHGRHLSR